MFDKAPELYDLFYEWKDYRAESDDSARSSRLGLRKR